ncbi:receptor-like protein kinase FERONIA [Tanacetum coccineum]
MSTHEQITNNPTSAVRNTGGRNGPQGLEEPMSDEILREMCDKNYHQLLPLIAEKMQKEKEQKDKLNAVKARLIYGEESGVKIRSREESHYSESKTLTAPRRRHGDSWVQRLKIAIGAARGLDYLHTGIGTQHGITSHRDVKSSNILLDENCTFGYLDPEYFYTSKVTRKTDVYAFGVVLFELLSGRLAVDDRYGEEQCSLVKWAKDCVKDQKLDQMVDSYIKGTISPKCLRRFAKMADRCLLSVPKDRPSMTEVVASLQAILELQKKCDSSAESAGIMNFTSKIHKYLASASKPKSGSGYQQKDRKPSQNDKTEHGMEKTVQNQGQSPKMPKSESILKNQQSNRSRN